MGSAGTAKTTLCRNTLQVGRFSSVIDIFDRNRVPGNDRINSQNKPELDQTLDIMRKIMFEPNEKKTW